MGVGRHRSPVVAFGLEHRPIVVEGQRQALVSGLQFDPGSWGVLGGDSLDGALDLDGAALTDIDTVVMVEGHYRGVVQNDPCGVATERQPTAVTVEAGGYCVLCLSSTAGQRVGGQSRLDVVVTLRADPVDGVLDGAPDVSLGYSGDSFDIAPDGRRGGDGVAEEIAVLGAENREGAVVVVAPEGGSTDTTVVVEGTAGGADHGRSIDSERGHWTSELDARDNR